jgi:hypothetical protein
VGVTERYSVRRSCWERGPHITEPRGSHGLAAARGTVYAVAGGGIRSNLHSAEALDVAQDASATSSTVGAYHLLISAVLISSLPLKRLR